MYPYLVIGTAQAPGQTLNANSGDQVKPIHIFHLNNPTVPFKSVVPPLKKQIRALRCFSGIAPVARTQGSNTATNDEYRGFVVGGTEGRAAVQLSTILFAARCTVFSGRVFGYEGFPLLLECLVSILWYEVLIVFSLFSDICPPLPFVLGIGLIIQVHR